MVSANGTDGNGLRDDERSGAYKSSNGISLTMEEAEASESMKQIRIHGPGSWGPMLWTVLHLWSMTKYPVRPTEAQRQEAVALLQKWFTMLILCDICTVHFAAAMKDAYPHTESRFTLSKFLIDVHNIVNKRNGAPLMTLDTVSKHYSRLPQASAAFSATLAGTAGPTPHTVVTNAMESKPVAYVTVIIGLAVVCVLGILVYALITRVIRGRARSIPSVSSGSNPPNDMQARGGHARATRSVTVPDTRTASVAPLAGKSGLPRAWPAPKRGWVNPMFARNRQR